MHKAASAFRRCLPTLSASDRLALTALCALAAALLLTDALLQGPFALDSTRTTAGARLDLNQASLAELVALPGLGPTLARRVVVYRQTHGPFRRLEALKRVNGIGAATLARLRPYLALDPDIH